MTVVGQREASDQTVAVRRRTEGDLGAMSIEDFAAAMQEEIESKGKKALDRRKTE